MKFGTITPELIGTSVGNDYYATRKTLIRDLSDAMRDELLELAGAGCAIIQMEEPNIHLVGIQRGGGAPAGRRVLRRDLQQHRQGTARPDRGVGAHLLGQSGAAAPVRDQPVVQGRAAASEQAGRRRADVRVLHERRDGSRSDRHGRSPDKKIAIGVVDHRNLQVERPEQVADLIRRALKHIPVERLVLSSDCGFGREGMSRRIAFYKMVVDRPRRQHRPKELGLPEAPCLAADPRYALAEEM